MDEVLKNGNSAAVRSYVLFIVNYVDQEVSVSSVEKETTSNAKLPILNPEANIYISLGNKPSSMLL